MQAHRNTEKRPRSVFTVLSHAPSAIISLWGIRAGYGLLIPLLCSINELTRGKSIEKERFVRALRRLSFSLFFFVLQRLSLLSSRDFFVVFFFIVAVPFSGGNKKDKEFPVERFVTRFLRAPIIGAKKRKINQQSWRRTRQRENLRWRHPENPQELFAVIWVRSKSSGYVSNTFLSFHTIFLFIEVQNFSHVYWKKTKPGVSAYKKKNRTKPPLARRNGVAFVACGVHRHRLMQL